MDNNYLRNFILAIDIFYGFFYANGIKEQSKNSIKNSIATGFNPLAQKNNFIPTP